MVTYKVTLKSGKELFLYYNGGASSLIENYIDSLKAGSTPSQSTMVSTNAAGKPFLVINIGEIAAIERMEGS